MSDDDRSYSASELSADELDALSLSSSSSPRHGRPRGASVHTAAALDVVDQPPRRSVRPSVTRSVHYSDLIDGTSVSGRVPVYPTPRPSSDRPRSSTRPPTASARPGTAASAAAIATVAPAGGDRLKHLQLHMEQLQQLYAHEIHKEELARREAFVQSMCTAGITLWRYVCSKPRFFTAVKALVTQYLPASDARFYEIEESERSGRSLVLADGRAIAVDLDGGMASGTIGLVGHAVRAVSHVSAAQWTTIQKKAGQLSGADIGDETASINDVSSSSSSSSRSSFTATDDATTSKSRWLDRYADCVLPSSNDHVLLLLLPLDRVYRDSGFDPEIDLTIKKRDLFEGSTTKQLLVVVLRDTLARPLGALEALVTTRKLLQIDFLDAFAGLLAAALEARRSICRPSTGTGLAVQIVYEADASVSREPTSSDAPSREDAQPEKSGTITLEIAPGTKMIVAGSASAQSAENDLPLLEAVRKPLAELLTQQQRWQRRAAFLEAAATAQRMFWSTMMELVAVTESSDAVDAPKTSAFYSTIRNAVRKLTEAEKTLAAVQFAVLFEGETLEQFKQAHRSLDAATPPTLSVEGQFGALERAMRTGEAFASTPLVSAMPVVVGELKAAVLVLIDSVDTEHDECVDYSKKFTLPLVMKAVELALWAERNQHDRGAARVEVAVLRDALEQEEARRKESEIVLSLSQSLTMCESLERVVAEVRRLGNDAEGEIGPVKIQLFVAEYLDEDDQAVTAEDPLVQSIWTVCDEDGGERVTVYERDKVSSSRRSATPLQRQRGEGMAAFVLASGAPLVYTQQHVAFDPTLRQNIQDRKKANTNEPTVGSCYYYAVPLGVQTTSHVRGVLEFTFASEEQQQRCATSSFVAAVSSTVEGFLDLHSLISSRDKRHAHAAAVLKNAHDAAWTQWREFVMALGTATALTGFDEWKGSSVSHVRRLLSGVGHVNVFVRDLADAGNDEAAGDDKVIECIARELLDSEGSRSPTLNVLNHTLLRSVRTYPLGELGLLVLAISASDPESDATLVDHFGQLASRLLSLQLDHLITRRRGITELERLHQSLSTAEQRLSVEQAMRAAVEQKAAQQRVLLRVHGLRQANEDDIASVDELLSKIILAINEEESQQTLSADIHHVGLLVPGTEADVWVMASSDGSAGGRIISSEAKWLASVKLMMATNGPFTGAQEDLVRRLWPTVESTGPCRLVIVPTNAPSQDNLHGLLVLLVPMTEPPTMRVDDAYVVDLARAVGRVVAWRNEQQCHRNVRAHLDGVTDNLAQCKATLEATHERHARRSRLWNDVLRRLWTLQFASTNDLKLTERHGEQAQLLMTIQAYTEEEIQAITQKRSACDVRVVAKKESADGLVASIVGEWLHPPQLAHFLAQPRRRLRLANDGMERTELYGGLSHQVLAISWQNGDTETALSSCVIAVCGRDLVRDEGDEWVALHAVFERVLVETMELVIVVENAFSLYHRLDQGIMTTSALSEQLAEKSALVARSLHDVSRRQRIDQAIARLLEVSDDSATFQTSLLTALEELPGICVWLVEEADTTLWTRQPDGTKRLRAYDMTSWKDASEIYANGKCVAVVETTNRDDVGESELKVVTVAVQQAFVRHELQQTLATSQAEHMVKATEEAEVRELAERRRSELARHWQQLDYVLQSRLVPADNLIDHDDPWKSILFHVEQEMLTAMPELTAVRFLWMDVDVAHRRVTESYVSAATACVPPDALHCVAALLDLWYSDSDAHARTRVMSAQDASVVSLVPLLSPTLSDSAKSEIMVVATRVHSSSSSDAFQYLVVLATSSAAMTLSNDIARALEIDAQLVATARERWLTLETTRCHATEAETSLAALQQSHDEAQQWLGFLQTTELEIKQLVESAVDAFGGDAPAQDPWETIAAHAERFVLASCACDGVELYDVIDDASEDGHRRLVPLVTRGAALSPSARSQAFAKSLDVLLHTDATAADESPLALETTPSGSRLVTTIHDVRTTRVVGIVVVHWNETAASDSAVAMVTSIVRPWLAIVFSMSHQNASTRIAQDALTDQFTDLTHEKHALELQALDLKHQLGQAEQRNASLQSTIQSASELLERVERYVARVAGGREPTALWPALAHEIASARGVHGVQLYEATGDNANEPAVVLSTLSSAEDAAILKVVGQRPDSGTTGGGVRSCLASQQPQEWRVGLSSEYHRVRLVCLSVSDGSVSHGLLLVFTSDPRMTHQQFAMLDRFVAMCVAVTTNRAQELEQNELQAATAQALETATQELTTQLQHTTASLARTESTLAWGKALRENVSHDVIGHNVWRTMEKSVQASASTTTTAKLTTMWRHLQDAAQQRLEQALADDTACVSVQLYGVVRNGASASKDAFVFSLASGPRSNDSSARRAPGKGFFCVALRELSQRREWRKMVQCVTHGEPVPADSSLYDAGTMLFPVRTFQVLRVLDGSDDILDDANDDDLMDETGGRPTKGAVVGVLVVKRKASASRRDGSCGDKTVQQLVQEFADALAPRVRWIGQVVATKQQHGSHTRLDAGSIHSAVVVAKTIPNHGKQSSTFPDATAAELPRRRNVIATNQPAYSGTDDVDRSDYGGRVATQPKAEVSSQALPEVPKEASRRSNQDCDDADADDNENSDVDSDDEREAQRARERVHAAVATGVLDFVLEVQSLHADEDEDDDAGAIDDQALRLLVARELKNVWCQRGDNRKHVLAACELFYCVRDVVYDTLDHCHSPKPAATTTAPHWVVAFATRTLSCAKDADHGYRVWKIDAARWIVSRRISPNAVALVTLSASAATPLASVFDSEDERVHLPSLMRAIASYVTLSLRAHVRQATLHQQRQQDQHAAATREADWQARCNELVRRSQCEDELSGVAARLLRANDERALIHTVLQTMRHLLGCDRVAFHAVSSGGSVPARMEQVATSTGHDSIDGVAMETLLRVRVMALACDDDDGDRGECELLGTLVASLAGHEAALQDDARPWTMRMLQRLADAMATGLTSLRKRLVMHEAEATLVAASAGIETQQRELLALQDENASLQQRVETLEAEALANRNASSENASLRHELQQLHESLDTSERARGERDEQLRQCEAQLVQVNAQLEQSIRAETQLLRLEETHAVTLAREARLDKKLLKRTLQLQQLVTELTTRRDAHERDQTELMELRRQVAVLMEKQEQQQHRQHTSGSMDASSVATAVMQAQAQAMAQTHAIQQHHSQAEATQQQRQQRLQTAVQRRFFRQLQLQQQLQKRKQLDLAHELRQLAALEVDEMTRRSSTTRSGSSPRKTKVASPRRVIIERRERSDTSEAASKVHDLETRQSLPTQTREPTASRLPPPRIAVAQRQRVVTTETAAEQLLR